jgi:hypothetical protein
MAYNAMATWQKSPSSNVETYLVAWIYNGNPAATVKVPQSAAGDSGGYSSDFLSGNPTITQLNPGDTVDCTITADDTVDNLLSTGVTPPAVIVPTPPPPVAPAPPASVALALTGP